LILGQHLLPSLLQVLELAFELVDGVFERHGEVTNDIGSIYVQRTADEYILEGSRLTELLEQSRFAAPGGNCRSVSITEKS
jgi:hypothetical protein